MDKNGTTNVTKVNIGRTTVDTNFNLPPESRRGGNHVMKFADFQAARNADLFMIHAVEFELNRGDTLVFVDVPHAPKESRKTADCDNVNYRSQPFRVHSEKLMATESTRLADMLGPSYQFRIQRRRKLVNKLPDGVKYVLDLTPPSEGDELVFQMTETSLTPGIMNWWTSYRYHGAEIGLVAGHDDVCCCKRQRSSYTGFEPDDDDRFEAMGGIKAKTLGTDATLPPLPIEMVMYKDQGKDKLHDTPAYRRIPDYCPVRHRNCIVRLMVMLEGREVALDSASRVWTLVAVAKILDCTSVVRDRVAQWIMHGRNSRFIEVLPEEALKIGYHLKLQDVTQTAFRILVNEMALQEAATDHDPATPKRSRPTTTLFGRRTGDCSDELNNVIQHAARTLVERVTRIDTLLRSEDLFDQWCIQEWGKLRTLEALLVQNSSADMAGSNGFREAINKLGRLMSQLRRTIAHKYTLSAQDFRASSAFVGMDLDRASYVRPVDWEPIEDIMRRFNSIQKLLCPFIYNEMGDRCNKHLFTNRYPDAGGILSPSIPSLLEDVQDSIRWLFGNYPELGDAAQWQFLINPDADKNYPAVLRLRPAVNLLDMEIEVKRALQPLTLCWIRHEIEPPANMTRHLLLTLSREEMKYLPLWAGGLDDGTGGVFEEQIPPTDMGPNGPGPAYHTGRTIPSASSSSSSAPPSMSDSLMEELAALKMSSAASGSVDAHDSMSTDDADRVMIADDVSMASESFNTGGSEYQGARLAILQHHQGTGEALDALVDTDDDDFDVDMQETPVASDGESSDDSVVVV